jgi:sugar phosphate permease
LLGSGGTTILLGLEPWREVFLAGGVFGAVALLLVTRLKEPERGAAKFKVRGFGQTLHLFRRHARAYSGTLLGLLALSLAVFATIAWSPTLLIRGHGFSPVSAGGFAGLASLLCALPGTWLAGALSDALDTPRRPDGVILTAIGMSVLLIPVMLTVGLARSSAIAATFLCLGYALLSMPTVLGGTVIQQLSPPDLRARLTAVYVLLVNLVALGAGPTAVAMLSDRLLGKDKLGSALAAVTSMAAMVAILSFLWARRSFVQKRYQDGGVRSISSISA